MRKHLNRHKSHCGDGDCGKEKCERASYGKCDFGVCVSLKPVLCILLIIIILAVLCYFPHKIIRNDDEIANISLCYEGRNIELQEEKRAEVEDVLKELVTFRTILPYSDIVTLDDTLELSADIGGVRFYLVLNGKNDERRCYFADSDLHRYKILNDGKAYVALRDICEAVYAAKKETSFCHHRTASESPALTQEDIDNQYRDYADKTGTYYFQAGDRDKKDSVNCVGTVMDSESSIAVPRATIEFNGERTIVTDQNGRFQIPDLPAGEYNWIIRAAGYKAAKYLNMRIDNVGSSVISFLYISTEREQISDHSDVRNRSEYAADEN